MTGLSRAELRRRSANTVEAATVWTGEPEPEKDAVADLPTEAPAALPAAPAPLPVSPVVSSRRAARAARVSSAVPEAPVVPVVETLPTSVEAPFASVAEAPATAVPAADRSTFDEFEAAARLFSFTGETPIQAPAAIEAEPPAASEPVAASEAPTRRSGRTVRRVATMSFSVGVMGIVGLMAVGMTTPAEAVAAASDGGANASVSLLAGDVSQSVKPDEIQAYVAPAGDVDISRTENYSTTTTAEIAAESGISNFSDFFHNNPNSPIQWPFAVGVPISYGFGQRDGEFHEGVDFTPGNGSPIQAIADGVVRVATEDGGGYGVHVIIDHIIDGQLVSSHYAHMQYGSLQVQVGQHVKVGTILGRTGNTCRSFGAHTHFEILMNGTTPIDPLPWLRQHAGG